MPRRPSTVLIAVAVTLSAAACGSTVVPSGSSALGAAADGGLSAPGPSSSGGVTSGDAGLGLPATGGGAVAPSATGLSAATSAAAGRSGTTGAAGQTTTGASSGLPVGPGVSATAINVGILYTRQSGDVGAQFGAKGLVKGDLRAEQMAIIDYINKHGGAAGRKLNAIAYDATTSSSAQSVCSYWTQDHKVFAGVYPGGQVPSDVGSACMAHAGALWINVPFVPGTEAYMDHLAPYYYTPGQLESVRMGQDYVDGLAASGFFTGQHKVGLLYYDVPALQASLQQGVLPALARHRVKLAAQPYAITYPSDDSQDAAAVSAVQNAELRFAAAGIDRVMFLDAGAGLAFFFMQNASTQGYHPRYGLETGSNPSFIEQQGFAKDQLPGSVGVGWRPAADVAMSVIPDSPARKLCRQIMATAGLAATAENDLMVQYDMCSSFFFLRDAINAAGVPNALTIRSALGRLAEAPDASANSMGDGYAPTKPWGAQYYQRLQFVTTCSCFRYVGARSRV